MSQNCFYGPRPTVRASKVYMVYIDGMIHMLITVSPCDVSRYRCALQHRGYVITAHSYLRVHIPLFRDPGLSRPPSRCLLSCVAEIAQRNVQYVTGVSYTSQVLVPIPRLAIPIRGFPISRFPIRRFAIQSFIYLVWTTLARGQLSRRSDAWHQILMCR